MIEHSIGWVLSAQLYYGKLKIENVNESICNKCRNENHNYEFNCYIRRPFFDSKSIRGATTGGNETAPSGIDWNTLCTDTSQMSILLQPCSDLVNSNGTLTPAGDTAMGCIRSVLSLGLGALHHGVLLERVIFGLGLLVQPTGCGDTVNMNAIESPNQFKFLTQAFSLH